MANIRVALIEDQDIVRIGLQSVFKDEDGIEVVGEAKNGLQGLDLLQTASVDVALVDVALPGMDGIELVRRFREFQKSQAGRSLPRLPTKVMMLTIQGSEEIVLASFAAGADSYCMKDTGVEQLVGAVRMTHQGDGWIDPAIASIILRQMRLGMLPVLSNKNTVEIRSVETKYEQMFADDPVTAREHQVLELMVEGCTNVVIADRLCITVGTVKTHVCNILAKLCADDRTEAAVRALRAGIVS